MISKIDRRQAYKELKSIIKRLQKAEAELDKLSIYKHRFPKQFLSIKTITKSPAKVDEVEKELKDLIIMIEKYRGTEYQGKNEEKETTNPCMADKDIQEHQIAEYAIEKYMQVLPNAKAAVTPVLGESKIAYDLEKDASATDITTKAGGDIEKATMGPEPEIGIMLKELSFTSGEWNAAGIVLENKGNAMAKKVRLDFSSEVEVKCSCEIPELQVGSKQTATIALKSKYAGDMPLDIDVYYNSSTNHEYKITRRFWLKLLGSHSRTEPSKNKSIII